MDWRLIVDTAGEPAWNMAVDEAVLEAFRLGLVQPTVRIYSWSRPAVSIGYFQDYARSIRSGGDVTVVRRPTGGRAVAHGTDITFSVVASSAMIGRRVGESYRRVGTAVTRALTGLGIAAEFSTAVNPRQIEDVINCFDLALRYEVSVEGTKILGSAQTRRGDAVLQQNSLMIESPPEAALRAIGSDKCVAIAACKPRTDVECAIAGEIAREFSVQLLPGQMMAREEELAEVLRRKYGSAEWTENRQGQRTGISFVTDACEL